LKPLNRPLSVANLDETRVDSESMGGPAAGILLRSVLDEGQICAFKTWLREAAEFYDGSQDNPLQDGWEYFLRWPVELGEEPSGRPCLGGIQMYRIDPELDSSGECGFSPAEWARYREALGWMPGCELSVGINCNRPGITECLLGTAPNSRRGSAA
jgi:hypothetical protein